MVHSMRAFALLTGIVAAVAASAPTAAAQDATISRLPSVTEKPSDPATAATFDTIRSRGGQIINLHLTLGHGGKIYQARQMLTYALRFDAVTSRRIRELTIMRVAQMTDSHYEWAQHLPIALACGYTKAQLDGLANWEAPGLFDEKDRAVLAFVSQTIGRNGNVDDAVFAELKRLYTPQEIIEIAVTATQYVTTGLLTRSLQIKPEQDGRSAAPPKC